MTKTSQLGGAKPTTSDNACKFTASRSYAAVDPDKKPVLLELEEEKRGHSPSPWDPLFLRLTMILQTLKHVHQPSKVSMSAKALLHSHPRNRECDWRIIEIW